MSPGRIHATLSCVRPAGSQNGVYFSRPESHGTGSPFCEHLAEVWRTAPPPQRRGGRGYRWGQRRVTPGAARPELHAAPAASWPSVGRAGGRRTMRCSGRGLHEVPAGGAPRDRPRPQMTYGEGACRTASCKRGVILRHTTAVARSCGNRTVRDLFYCINTVFMGR